MGRYGRNEGKNLGKVQINLETCFICNVVVAKEIIFREMLLSRGEHWLFNPHSSLFTLHSSLFNHHSLLFNCRSSMFISNLRYHLPNSHACARILQGFCTFCCHKCHTVFFQTSVFDFQVSRRFSENNTSFYWKQHVVLMKTTRRFNENNTSF